MVLLEDGSWSNDMMSDTAGRSSLAATRGKMDLADEEWAETTCVKGDWCDNNLSNKGVTTSGKGVVYCGEAACSKVLRPVTLDGEGEHTQCTAGDEGGVLLRLL